MRDAQALKTYKKEFKIENGPDGDSIPLSDLLQLAMQTSGEHDQSVIPYIEEKGDYLIGDNQTWVITQYLIKADELPKYGEPFSISTRVVEANRFFITRQFIVEVDDDTIVELFAQFAGIDFEKRRMVRLNMKAFLETDLLNEDASVTFPKIMMPETSQVVSFATQQRQVMPEDIDSNQHVNNGSYLRWIEEQLPNDIQSKYQQAKLQIKYGKEILPNENVKIETFIDDSDSTITTIHLISNLSQETEACRIKINWLTKD